VTSPVATVFGKTKQKQMDLDRPEGCDHDRNTYYYRLVDGAMVLRGIALGPRWESRPMDWRGLSCYKRKEDEQMAKMQAPPYEELKQVFIDAEYKIDRVRKVLKVNWLDAKRWLKDAGLIDDYNRPTDKVTASKAQALLESVDAGKPVTNYGGPVDLINLTIDDCHKITKRLFGDRLTENKDGTVNIGPPVRSMGCIEPELSDKATEVVTAPIGVEVPQYEPEDNDFNDEPIPYVVKPDPLDAQIDIMLDILWAEKRAKLKAHLKPLLSDVGVWDMVKHIVRRGLA
jgi:hypothetical protein